MKLKISHEPIPCPGLNLAPRSLAKFGKGFPKILKVAPPERGHQWQFQGALHPEYEAHHDLKREKFHEVSASKSYSYTFTTKEKSIDKTPSKRVQ